ncbi:MAG: hypothetical protein KDN22_26905 [Verrucomicrobiae bacterium]|nr:hypothetical protein [Verrucomicrobiae bacterium]
MSKAKILHFLPSLFLGAAFLVEFPIAASADDATLKGLWEFDDPTNPQKATIGQDLAFGGVAPAFSASVTDDQGTVLNGVITTPPPAQANRIACVHGIRTKSGEKYVNQYSIVADILSPEASRSSWRSIFQTRGNNSDDGDYFIRPDNDCTGVAYLGYSAARFDETKWCRLVLTVDDNKKGAMSAASHLRTQDFRLRCRSAAKLATASRSLSK